MTSFEEIERISDMEFLSHMQKIGNFFGRDVKTYVTFGKEIVKELEKNSFMFANDETIEKVINEKKKEKLEARKNIQMNIKVEDEEREI